MHVLFCVNKDIIIIRYYYNHIDAIGEHSLSDYVVNVVGKIIKYVIVVILSAQSYNLVGPMVFLH